MARMIPQEPDANAPSSEQKVFSCLHDGLPDDWVVLHSRRYLLPAEGTEHAHEGEADFVVLDPARGYLCLEVKGGRVSRDRDGWRTRNRYGEVFRIKDPGRQAQQCAHDVWKYLKQQPRFATGGRLPRYGWGVVFPEVDAPSDLGPDLPRKLVVDERDLLSIRKAVDRIFGAHRSDYFALSAGVQRAILNALAPKFRLVPSLATQIEGEEAALLRATEEQFNLLDNLAEMPRLAVKGVAGSGKTVVAMEKARRLAERGERVLFLCFNKPLALHLDQHADNFEVHTFHALCSELAAAAGIEFEVPRARPEEQEFWREVAPDLLVRALEACPGKRWDSVVVDEGQDFIELWWLAVEQLLREPSRGSLWVFFDPAQDIYGGGPTAALGFQAATLTFNCRNTRRIATFSSSLLGLEAKLRPGAPEGVEVAETTCAGEAAMLREVRRALHRLTAEDRLAPDRIVVLSAHGKQRSIVWKQRTFGNLRLVEHPKPPGPGEVAFSSLHRFKGLEADVILLCEVDPDQATFTDKHMYVGCSRAKHVLFVLKYQAG